MAEITSLLANPLVWKVLGAYWVFSAAVGALPTPDKGSSPFYIWVFRFSHGLSGNLNRAAIALKVPGADSSGGPQL
jgi:hypothetical protein